MRKHATIYRKGDLFYLHSDYRTKDGVWIAGAPFEKHGPNPPSDELGSALVRVLECSFEGVPHPGPAEWKEIRQPLLELVGVKSWAAFMKKMICCSTMKEGERIVFLPKINDSRAFIGTPGLGPQYIDANQSSREIGEQVMDVFKKIESFS